MLMDEQALKSVVLEVSAELGIPSGGVQVEPAMGAPNSDSIQVRIPDGRGDTKAVVVGMRASAAERFISA